MFTVLDELDHRAPADDLAGIQDRQRSARRSCGRRCQRGPRPDRCGGQSGADLARPEQQRPSTVVTAQLSLVRDIDLAEAITQQKTLEAAYQAALGITGRVGNLSLLDFLRWSGGSADVSRGPAGGSAHMVTGAPHDAGRARRAEGEETPMNDIDMLAVMTPEGIPGFERSREWMLEREHPDAVFSLLRSRRSARGGDPGRRAVEPGARATARTCPTTTSPGSR